MASRPSFSSHPSARIYSLPKDPLTHFQAQNQYVQNLQTTLKTDPQTMRVLDHVAYNYKLIVAALNNYLVASGRWTNLFNGLLPTKDTTYSKTQLEHLNSVSRTLFPTGRKIIDATNTVENYSHNTMKAFQANQRIEVPAPSVIQARTSIAQALEEVTRLNASMEQIEIRPSKSPFDVDAVRPDVIAHGNDRVDSRNQSGKKTDLLKQRQRDHSSRVREHQEYDEKSDTGLDNRFHFPAESRGQGHPSQSTKSSQRANKNITIKEDEYQ